MKEKNYSAHFLTLQLKPTPSIITTKHLSSEKLPPSPRLELTTSGLPVQRLTVTPRLLP